MATAAVPVLGQPVQAHRWLGQGASAGRATGPARVLRSEADLAACTTGDILVMRHATPAVARGAVRAAGLVCETGGILNHLAILARELGTPCVTGVHGIVDALESGVQLRVDGTTGGVVALGPVAAPAVNEQPTHGTLIPVLQFGRFSPTFECDQAVLTPEAAVRAAALAVLPAALGFDTPLALVFDGNRILAADGPLRDLCHTLVGALEADPTNAELMRASYDDTCGWSGWQHANADASGAIERFVLLNCLTWAAALAKEELALRLRRVLGAHASDAREADELLLDVLTMRGASYLLADSPTAVERPPDPLSPVRPAESDDVRSRAQALSHLVSMTEHKNTRLARLAALVGQLPIADSLGLVEWDLNDDGTDAGRAAMVERVVAVMARPVLKL